MILLENVSKQYDTGTLTPPVSLTVEAQYSYTLTLVGPPPPAVPEPSTLALLALGAAAVAGWRRWRRRTPGRG
jgi:hypothetical protein